MRAAICSGVGSSPPSWTMSRSVFESLLCVSTMWTGMRIVRAWSLMARLTLWRIHQLAYVLNL